MEHNSRKLIKKLQAEGWVLVATKGSHHQFKHPEKAGRVTVPHKNKNRNSEVDLQTSWLDIKGEGRALYCFYSH